MVDLAAPLSATTISPRRVVSALLIRAAGAEKAGAWEFESIEWYGIVRLGCDIRRDERVNKSQCNVKRNT